MLQSSVYHLEFRTVSSLVDAFKHTKIPIIGEELKEVYCDWYSSFGEDSHVCYSIYPLVLVFEEHSIMVRFLLPDFSEFSGPMPVEIDFAETERIVTETASGTEVQYVPKIGALLHELNNEPPFKPFYKAKVAGIDVAPREKHYKEYPHDPSKWKIDRVTLILDNEARITVRYAGCENMEIRFEYD